MIKREEKLFDIGQWVATEDGFGQVIYNRNLFYEEFSLAVQDVKIGSFNRTVYICKILSDFDGRVKKRLKLDLYTSINSLNKKEVKIINRIKSDFPEKYNQYVLFEPTSNLTRQIFLEYKVEDKEIAKIHADIEGISKDLPRSFTFKELKKASKASALPFAISDFIKHNETKNREECITIRLDSERYKMKRKEAIFRGIVLIRQ